MTNEVVRANLTALRANHNMSANQIAMICGVSEETYTKMELGFEDIPYEILTKLAGFYAVDVGRLVNEKLVNESHQNDTFGANKEKVTYKKTKKAFEVLSLVFVASMLVFYALVPIGNVLGYNVYMYDYLSSSGISFIVGFFSLLFPIWQLTNSIMMLSSERLKQGTYGKVSKIIDVVVSALMIMLTGIVCSWAYANYIFVYFALAILLTLFEILALVFRNKEKVKK